MNGSTRYDYRRVSHFDGLAGVEGDYSDNATLSGRLVKDTLIYKNSREMHSVWIRVQDPTTSLWSMYEVNLFASAGGARITVWVNTIEEKISY